MKIPFLLLLLLLLSDIFSQVPKQVVIEHFTNTFCSICGNSNPDLHTNMANYPNVLRITYHPSSPYPNCTLNQHNILGNDDRTNQYGIYGATPVIIIQGESQHFGGSSFSNTDLFDDYTGEMSPLSIDILTDTSDVDSISVLVTITVEDNLDVIHQNPILYVGLAEDTIYFNAPNGENRHHNVFRKELYGSMGTGIILPDIVGHEESFEFKVKRHSDWDMERILAFATIQNSSSNEILQSGASNFTPDYSVSIKKQMENSYKYFNNNNILTIELHKENLYDNVVIFDLQGKVIISQEIGTQNEIQINLQSLNNSMYIVQLINSDIPASTSFKIVK